MSSIVPPLPVGIALSTSRQRQSRNHDGRSLRISATCNELYHIKILYNRNAEIRGDGKRTSSIGRKIPLWALDSQDRRLVLLPHYSCGKQQRFQ
jgi:hypothetical protein